MSGPTIGELCQKWYQSFKTLKIYFLDKFPQKANYICIKSSIHLSLIEVRREKTKKTPAYNWYVVFIVFDQLHALKI